MSKVLDIVPLRSLIAVADAGGFHRAAAQLHVSQSAVSQHVRRLERVIGEPLVEMDGRRTRFTVTGQVLLNEARQVIAAHDAALRRLTVSAATAGELSIGTTDHAADHIVPPIVDALAAAFPQLEVTFRFDRTARLNEAIDRGALDIAVYIAEAGDRSGVSVGSLPLVWCSTPGLVPPRGDEPWPLLAIEQPCAIRAHALTALADHDMPAKVVAEAAYLAGVVNAARAGLGVALLAVCAAVPTGLVARSDLPAVAPVALAARFAQGVAPEVTGCVLATAQQTLAEVAQASSVRA